MNSYVLVNQHHHHEFPSLNWFSTKLIVLQPDNDPKATLQNLWHWTILPSGEKIFLANIPLHIVAEQQCHAPSKLKQVVLVQLEIIYISTKT